MKRFHLIWLALLAVVLLASCRTAPPATPSVPGDTSAGWALLVREAGPRWLGPEWWQAQGYDSAQLDPDQIRLQQRSEAAPFLWLESDEGPGLLFTGDVEPGRLGLAGGYHLTVVGGGGERLTTDNAAVAAPLTPQIATTATLYLEVDDVYRPTSPDGVNWLWTSFNTVPTLTLTFPLTQALSVSATVTLQFWGQSSMPQNPDHHIRVSWNGTVVDDHFWDGSQLETWSVVVPAPQSGDNTLMLVSPGDTEAPVEVTWLDRVEVTWQRALTHTGVGWDGWTAGPEAVACWDGVPEGQVAVILAGANGSVRGLVDPEVEAGRLCIAQNAGDRGWLGIPTLAPPPDIVRSREVVSDDALLAADYLVVAPRLFHAVLSPLIAAREADGMTVALVTPEAIYDAYGIGVPDGEAIRRLVVDLHARGALRYVLLVGDASANPATMWEPDNPVVPTGWVRTVFVGDTPSDRALVADDNGEPLVAVGRFPVSTVAEVQAMVAKTLAWEPGARLLLLNDDEAEFVAMADALAAIQPPDLRLDAGDENLRRDLLRWLKDGPGMLVYTGHGSLPLLGDEKFLTVEDAGTWDGPTVVVAWTCLCASFTHPTQSGLSEAWLRAEKGTAAVVGPTGETTTGDQSAMAAAFHRALAEGKTLGDALLAGWRASTSKDAETSFVLLGDPALRVVAGP